MKDVLAFHDVMFSNAADSLGPSGASTVPTPAPSIFPSGSAAGGSERVDYGIPAPQCQGPQAGSENFNTNSIAPDATPPETYREVVDRSNFPGTGKSIESLESKRWETVAIIPAASRSATNPPDAIRGPAPSADAGFAAVAAGAAGVGGGTGAFAGRSVDQSMTPQVGGERITRDPWQADQPILPVSESAGPGPRMTDGAYESQPSFNDTVTGSATGQPGDG